MKPTEADERDDLDVIEEFAADGPDEALDVTVHLQGANSGRDGSDAEHADRLRAHERSEGSARGAQEPQSAEAPMPPFGHLMGFWRGTPPGASIPTRLGKLRFDPVGD